MSDSRYEYTLKFILKLIETIRPKFFNKITWVIVVSGLTLISTPLLEKVITSLIEGVVKIKITGDNDPIYGLLLVTLGLIYNLLMHLPDKLSLYISSIKTSDSKTKHDISVFHNLESFFSEDDLNNFMYDLTHDHCYYGDMMDKIIKFTYNSSQPSSSFITEKITNSISIYTKSLHTLMDYLSHNFHVYPNNQESTPFRFCLQPYLNEDRGGFGIPNSIYAEYANELEKYCDPAIQSYRDYRLSIKNNLYI